MRSGRLRSTDLGFALLKASTALSEVIRQGRSLDRAIEAQTAGLESPQARGAITDLAFYGTRWYGRGSVLVRLLTGKPSLKPPLLEDFLCLCLSLLWDVQDAKYPDFTVVNQAVAACESDKRLQRAKGLVNGVLRSFLRDRHSLIAKAQADPLALWGFPEWWVSKLKRQHPDSWELILQQANTRPPMTLRVNQRVQTGDSYLQLLQAQGLQGSLLDAQTVVLNKAMPVEVLPGFSQGHVSVQDWAAQWAAPLLNPQKGQRILDACAAPGGKTGHLLELADCEVTALDSSPGRLKRVESNFDRLRGTLGDGCKLQVKVADAACLPDWFDGECFDGILADLPCSGSGVVRRHPDIRWLRRETDLEQLSLIQHRILDSLWKTLKPGGTLLLVTCSIFQEEGRELAEAFKDRFKDAQAEPAPGVVLPRPDSAGGNDAHELASMSSPDGFFYARFTKRTV